MVQVTLGQMKSWLFGKPRIRFSHWSGYPVSVSAWVATLGNKRAYGLNPADAYERLTGGKRIGRYFSGLDWK